ncbi:MAG: DUF1499 domain-containing protein [Planctomycetota bacterium]
MLKGLIQGLTKNVACFDDSDDDPRLHRPNIMSDRNDVIDRLRSWAENRSRWQIEKVFEESGQTHIWLTRQTRVIRFTDDVKLVLNDADGTTMIDGESRSRIGKGDLGQNARNLIEIRSALANHG